MSQPDCLFCRIVSKELPTTLLYEDDMVLAFRDIAPKAPVHVLIIPKRHIDGLHAIQIEDGTLLGRLFACLLRIADETGVARSGYRAVINTGSDGGQSVFHLHLHLLGGRQMAWPPG